MHNVYFTSDLHLGHIKAAECRGYTSTDEHDEAVVESLSVVKKRDTLIVLGDVATNLKGLSKMEKVLGYKILIMGNHDDKSVQTYLEYFNKIHGFYRYKELWLSHCPVHPQELYRVIANVHGHIHNGATPLLPLPYINMNWDFWRRPVTLEEVKSFIANNKVPYEVEEQI